MYDGIDSSYLTIDIPSAMPQNCSTDQTYFLNSSHKSPSKDHLGANENFESPVSSIGSPDLKPSPNSDESFNNLDKKSFKILQRPSTARSTEGRLHLDTEALYVNQYPRRGHRKKTLSLNPEEREALESLIEDVIIVGLDDAAIDSEESSDENVENDKNTGGDSSNEKHSPKFTNENKEFGDKFSNQRETPKNIRPKVNHASNARIYGNKEMIRRHNVNNGKDLSRMNFNKNNMNNANNNVKDFARNREINFLNNINKLSKEQQTAKKLFPNVEGHQKGNFPDENVENITKNSVTGMLGINIYPAQLKVAIKHMDSLPPRFLRRLQTGQNRISGSEPALQSLPELNGNGKDASLYGQPPSRLTVGSDIGPSTASSAEKDRTKSKQTQLEETKKIIRNLLSDLDQYTDEGITTPGLKDKCPFNPPPFQESKMAYEFKPPMPNPVILSPNSLFRMPHTRFNSESQLNTLDLPQPTTVQVNPKGFLSYSTDAFRSREFNSLDVAHSSTGYLNLTSKQPSHNYDVSGVYFHNDHLMGYPMSHHKKTNLKVDAPIFISNQFQAKQNTSATKSQHTDAKPVDNNIAFLPGALNVDVNQQQVNNNSNNKKNQPQIQQPQQLINPNVSRNNSPYLFKMGSMYPPMPMGPPPSLPNGMILSHHAQAGMMRMLNFAPMPPYSSGVPYNNFYGGNSMFIRPDYPSSHQAFQPWVSVNNADLPSGDIPQAPWFHHGYNHPQHHDHIESAGNQFVDHLPQIDVEQDWNTVMNYSAGDVLETYPVEIGRQRVMQMLNEGLFVMVILVGNPQGDKLSKLQMNMNGVFVLNLHNGPPGPNLSPSKLKEQREWNYKQVDQLENWAGHQTS
ncbi:hypothetical protein HELRODRAFT_160513 [Helobdella robusta]|uniref:Uncharacterized protein n=1 Tax=Helobdella robusta TaxID=6412 RepID=T1EQC4_HELRO|nr:hypothetical protein HELRODRAFT_160513 [Helobdella robusta]ESO06347.1 hypothetical protein HELRODRAFT_160513 [Helobdella robusta]